MMKLVDNLQQANKIDNLQQVCDVFGCVTLTLTPGLDYLRLGNPNPILTLGFADPKLGLAKPISYCRVSYPSPTVGWLTLE